LPPAMPRPPMLLSLRYMFVVSLFGLLYTLNSSRHYLKFTDATYLLLDLFIIEEHTKAINKNTLEVMNYV
jgi:hypothetical protein